ncbi:MAG: hypothetical protein ACO23N_05450 [Opitutales bacterium]
MSALTTEQRTQVARWVSEGATLSQVQQRLQSELGISMTYMDVRFLVDDLNLTLIDKPEPKAEEAVTMKAADVPADAAPAPAATAPGTTGKVSISVDTIAQPGYMVTGSVIFSDGEKAMWAIDMEGRPRMSATTPNYRPTPADIQEFQVLLDAEFRKLGY